MINSDQWDNIHHLIQTIRTLINQILDRDKKPLISIFGIHYQIQNCYWISNDITLVMKRVDTNENRFFPCSLSGTQQVIQLLEVILADLSESK